MIVPVALAVTVIASTLAATSTFVGCGGEHRPRVDAARDGVTDTPLG